MKVSEDRFPLLYVYLEDQEEPCNVRARTLTKGAAEIMGKWPQYLTFVTYMSVIGLLSLLVCFILSVFVLSLTPHQSHNPGRFSIVKCDSKEGSNHAFHLTNFDGVDADNATFIVDVRDDRSAAACAIESYLTWTSLPVYHVRITGSDAGGNETIFREFQKKFKNYRIVTVRADDFLRGTSFADSTNRNENTLRFLSKVLLAWNFGGIILDSDLIALSNFRNLLGSESDLVMGLIGPDNVLISAKRVCHSFMFSLMKYMTKGEEGSTTQAKVTEAVHTDFCSRGRNCSTVRVISKPYFCESGGDGCVFVKYKNGATYMGDVLRRICPLARFFS